MAVRPIVLYKTNEAELRQRSEPIPDGSSRTKNTISDLKDTLLHHGNGVGLAAPQIGVHQRAIVVCLGAGNGKNPGFPVGIINPVIIEAGRELPDFDGCLSLPGLYGETVRPHFMRLQGLDEHGKAFEWTLDGFDAVVVHHEVDHLNGVLFIDRVSSPDKLYTEAEAQGVRV
ncbi:peptide deformylase [Myxococcota bacterium]